MRAERKKHEIRKRFAVVIGVVAVGVMALGTQTALAGKKPHLQLWGTNPQSQADPNHPGSLVRSMAVSVTASCGELSGPPVPWAPGLLKKLRPPANVPDLGCHLSAEGKVMGDKLR